jgi:2-polyprenyl-3-methyl-5-hydroxy-6-metoxy-1,4-benzoquinol methylase
MKKRHDELAATKRTESYSKIWFTKALELLERSDTRFKRVIDVGAGKGEFLEILKQKYPDLQLYAIDYTDTNLAVLKRKGINTIKLDLDSFELEELKPLQGKFDLAVCLAVVEHIFDLDRLFLLFNRVLKNDGYLLIATPNTASFPSRLFHLLRGYPYGESHHVRFLTKRRLEQYAYFTGFNVVGSNDYFGLNEGMIKRGFGVSNKYLASALANIIFRPFWVSAKLGVLTSLSNTDIVYLARKNNLPPLGLEIDNFRANFESLAEHDRKIWQDKIKEYLKKDKMSDFVYLKEYLVSLISGGQDEGKK